MASALSIWICGEPSNTNPKPRQWVGTKAQKPGVKGGQPCLGVWKTLKLTKWDFGA